MLPRCVDKRLGTPPGARPSPPRIYQLLVYNVIKIILQPLCLSPVPLRRARRPSRTRAAYPRLISSDCFTPDPEVERRIFLLPPHPWFCQVGEHAAFSVSRERCCRESQFCPPKGRPVVHVLSDYALSLDAQYRDDGPLVVSSPSKPLFPRRHTFGCNVGLRCEQPPNGLVGESCMGARMRSFHPGGDKATAGLACRTLGDLPVVLRSRGVTRQLF
jgi:hypothetical protein